VLNVVRNAIFRLSRLKDDRLNVMTVSGEGVGVLTEIGVNEGISMLFVLNAERQLLFRLNQFRANQFFVEIVSKKLLS